MAKPHVPPRFTVETASRHPRLGIDYNPATHKFTNAYLNPLAYTIAIDDFPGKTLFMEAQQLPGPAGGTIKIPPIWKLDCPSDTSGWNFSITSAAFNARGSRRLVTTGGLFNEDRQDNAWNFQFAVPGPGTYIVKVDRMRGQVIDRTRSERMTVHDFLVVSIGDSAASGQGNPDVPGRPDAFDPDLSWWEVFVPPIRLFKLSRAAVQWARDTLATNFPTLARKGKVHIGMDPDPVWFEPKAYRSLRSGHAHAAKLLENRGKGTVVTFLPFGRTGSEIPNGLIGPRTSDGKQIDAWVGNIGQIAESG